MTDIIKRQAVRAVIIKDGKLLIIKESDKYRDGTQKGKWDFPGGKIEEGETDKDAVDRETKEESGLEVEVQEVIHEDFWEPVVHGKQLHITGRFYICKFTGNFNDVKLSEDHDEFAWIDPKDYEKYDILKENIPAIKALL